MCTKLKYHTRNCLAFIIVFQFGDIAFGKSISNVNKGHSIFPEIPRSAGNTTEIVKESDQNGELYADLIDIMAKLNVISPTSTTCYVLQKIVREVISDDESGANRKFGVYLYFEEKAVDENFKIESNEKLYSDSASGLNDDNNLRMQKNNEKSKTDSECKSIPSMVLPPGGDFRMHSSENASSEDRNETGGTLAVLNEDVEEESGLSRTQIVVIATCSAVIGAFFLVAGIMRIRNYVKRVRAQDAEQCAAFQRSGSGHQGSNLPSEQARRESAASRSSRQSNSTVKGGNLYFQVNNNPAVSIEANSAVDIKPIVVVTTASSPASPTDSHASIDFIDDENNKKKTRKPAVKSEEEEDVIADSCPLLSESDITVSMPVRNFQPPVQELQENATQQEAFSSIPSVSEQEKSDYISLVDPLIQSNEGYQNHPDYPVALETDVDITTQSPNPMFLPLANMFSVSSGLTQSDTSLSSANIPPYGYGNQSEYLWDSGYGNHAYCPPQQEETYSEVGIEEIDNFDSSTFDSVMMENKGEWNDINNELDQIPCQDIDCEDLFEYSNHTNGVSPNDKSSYTENSEEPLLKNYSENMTLPPVEDLLLAGADNMAMSDSFENIIADNGCVQMDMKMIPFETHMTMDSLDDSHDLLLRNIENTSLL